MAITKYQTLKKHFFEFFFKNINFFENFYAKIKGKKLSKTFLRKKKIPRKQKFSKKSNFFFQDNFLSDFLFLGKHL